MVTQQQVHDTLVGARDILAERGLAKEALMHNGAVCLRGALFTTITGMPHWPPRAVWPLAQECERAMGFGVHAYDKTLTGRGDPPEAATWNNHPDTTLEMVLERFDQAIEHTRVRELILA